MSTAPIKIGDYVKIKNYNHFTGHIGEVLTVDIMESEALVSIKSKYGRQACSPQRIPLLYLDAVDKPDYKAELAAKGARRRAGAVVSMKFQSAVPGDLFYENTALDGSNLNNPSPRVLAFDEVFLDKDGRAKVRFMVVCNGNFDGTLDTVVANANDSTGKYPKLNRAHLKSMRERRAKLERELKALDIVLGVADCLVKN